MIVDVKRNRELNLKNAQNTQNENRAETISLVVPEEYESYNKKIVFITPDGNIWDVITNNEYKITNAITKYKDVEFYIWLTKEVDGQTIDFRTKTRPLKFYYNEDASGEITPEEISGVNTVVNILEEEITKVDSLETKLRALITDIQNKLDNGEFNAKINGKNAIEIEAGNNIRIEDTENGIRINSTGGGSGGTSNHSELNNLDYEHSGHTGFQPAGNYVEDNNYVHTDNNYTNAEKQKLSGLSNYDDTEIKQDMSDLETNKADRSEIPNVSNFITNAVNNLLNYYLKSEIYTKQEVNNLIGQISTLQFQVVNELPQTGDSKYIYLVPSANPKTKNVKDEYIWTNNAWEQIGNTQVDLTGYATETWVNTQISGFLTQAQIQALITNALTDYAKTEDLPTKTSDLTNDSNFVSDSSYVHTDNNFTTTLKTKLDGIESGAEANVQANWNETDTTSDAYIQNKPTIPTVPTNVSAFTNDAGYLTSHQDISGKEDKTNKVTSISSSSTDTQYPSAKCVYDLVGDVESILTTLTTGGGVA